MKNEEILKKAIERVIKNGFKHLTVSEFSLFKKGILRPEIYLFNHDFAKAFWGEKTVKEMAKRNEKHHLYHWDMITWKYHLQQLVLCEKPLEYLAKFL